MLRIPPKALGAGWHEFRYPRPAVDEPTDAFKRGVEAAGAVLLAERMDLVERVLVERLGRSTADELMGAIDIALEEEQ
ncbi:hypothetical protein KALB_4920 [Kutzneria albida DSM 43870]|uniref:Uncharacterized protein n=2 Tax=Kutzneria TaxID=43356 RepID=W5WBN0_9PSEU|nr:hypothetical protein KALB_4920 [Kutzneria albida DSM 43870]